MFGYDFYNSSELEPSWSTQLDMNGMQPHSREAVERSVNHARSERKYQMIEGELLDYVEGIQFTDKP